MQQGRWEGRVVRCSEVRVVLRAAKAPFSNTLALGPALKKQAIFSPKLQFEYILSCSWSKFVGEYTFSVLDTKAGTKYNPIPESPSLTLSSPPPVLFFLSRQMLIF